MVRRIAWMVLALVLGRWTSASAQESNRPTAGILCAHAIAEAQAELQRLLALKRFLPSAVSEEAVRAASASYVERAESCQADRMGQPLIDEGPLRPGGDETLTGFATMGAKWGSGAFGGGVGVSGPGLPGGSVTYSFMGTGVDMGSHADANQALSQLPGFQACFLTEIRGAFAIWSAVANIQFVEVADNGVRFDGAGARGDIRIGAHTFDGPWGVLAHAYYPPPGGTSAAGDMHFDRHETYSCNADPGRVDIGIVALHEIGHAMGLAHETRAGHTALMNPYYNPVSAPMLLADDAEGAASIYGIGTPSTSALVVNFSSGLGLWELVFGRGWQHLNGLSPTRVVTGDLDGNGIDEVIGAYGDLGLWVHWNNVGWLQLHPQSPAQMVVGDVDASGGDDLVASFTGAGVWMWRNASTWSLVSGVTPSVMAMGNIDGLGGDDLVVTFPGWGVWSYRNDAAWSHVHPVDASAITVQALDGPSGPEDLLLDFPQYGLFQCLNLTTWTMLHGLHPKHMAVGNLDGGLAGDIVIDFGAGLGIWTLKNGTTWAHLHGLTSEGITLADLDGNGQSDVVIDFGAPYGFWIHMNASSWLQGHPISPTDVQVASLR